MSAPLVPFRYNARVLSVQDGDTVNCRIDWGFRRHDEPVPVRILGIAALPLSAPGGPEARAHVAQLLPIGAWVVLYTAEPDKYAPRWLAALTYRADDGDLRNLGADLIAEGWAVPWNGRGAQPRPVWPRVAA